MVYETVDSNKILDGILLNIYSNGTAIRKIRHDFHVNNDRIYDFLSSHEKSFSIITQIRNNYSSIMAMNNLNVKFFKRN